MGPSERRKAKEKGREHLQHSHSHLIGEAEDLYRTGRNAEVVQFVNGVSLSDDATSQRLLVLRAMAKFDLGDVVASISDLRAANSSFGAVGPSASQDDAGGLGRPARVVRFWTR
jgi:hypothetical protein